jgi:hypothetical protein
LLGSELLIYSSGFLSSSLHEFVDFLHHRHLLVSQCLYVRLVRTEQQCMKSGAFHSVNFKMDWPLFCTCILLNLTLLFHAINDAINGTPETFRGLNFTDISVLNSNVTFMKTCWKQSSLYKMSALSLSSFVDHLSSVCRPTFFYSDVQVSPAIARFT